MDISEWVKTLDSVSSLPEAALTGSLVATASSPASAKEYCNCNDASLNVPINSRPLITASRLKLTIEIRPTSPPTAEAGVIDEGKDLCGLDFIWQIIRLVSGAG